MTDILHLGQAAQWAAARFGNRPALVCNGRTLTFSDLHTAVEQVAASLAAAGVGHGDVVTLYAGNSWEWVVSYYAIARLGGVINPVNAMLTPDEVAFVVNDCKARAIIVSKDKLRNAGFPDVL